MEFLQVFLIWHSQTANRSHKYLLIFIHICGPISISISLFVLAIVIAVAVTEYYQQSFIGCTIYTIFWIGLANDTRNVSAIEGGKILCFAAAGGGKFPQVGLMVTSWRLTLSVACVLYIHSGEHFINYKWEYKYAAKKYQGMIPQVRRFCCCPITTLNCICDAKLVAQMYTIYKRT